MASPSSRIHTVEDARRVARRRLPRMVFDYIDGAARDGRGEAAAREAIHYVFVGRPMLFGHAADGARGLARVVDAIAAEADIALAMLGRRSVAGLRRID